MYCIFEVGYINFTPELMLNLVTNVPFLVSLGLRIEWHIKNVVKSETHT